MTRTLQGEISDDLTVSDSLTIHGHLSGDTHVVGGGHLLVQGAVTGQVVVEAKGSLHVQGFLGPQPLVAYVTRRMEAVAASSPAVCVLLTCSRRMRTASPTVKAG